jgi:hypothetical protein
MRMEAVPPGKSETMKLSAGASRGEDLGQGTDSDGCPLSHVALTAKIASRATPARPCTATESWRRELLAGKPHMER